MGSQLQARDVSEFRQEAPTYASDCTNAHQLQQELPGWVVETAGQRIHGTTAQRPLQVFSEVEKAALLPMPAVPYQPVVWKPAKVYSDCHVSFGRTLYSAPWRWIGTEGWVRAVADCIQIYMGQTRVATHRRGRPGERITVESHLPEGRRDLRHRTRGYWLERAQRVGPETAAYVREVFASDDVLEQINKVQRIVTLLETYPTHRAEAACRRAFFYANYQYRAIEQILTDGLDGVPLPVVTVAAVATTAPPRYARNIQQLLDMHMEENDEPN